MSQQNVDEEYLAFLEKDAEAYLRLYQLAFDAAQALGCFVDDELERELIKQHTDGCRTDV